ncbi:MAG TPA: ATP-dependent zinc metalloprotease FtsH [Actinomycetota bacterium]|nr:ATP-dependent zinc metalloprotease FtsH [Actinomycetota bacterium]
MGVALVLFFSLEGVLFNQPENITFSRFLDLVQSKQVEKVDVAQDSISGTYRSQGGKEQSFSTTMPPGYDTTQLIKTLNSQGAEVRASQPSALGSFFLYWILPFLIIGGIYYLLMRRIRNQFGGGAGGPLSFGRNKAKLYDRTDMKTTFNDVAGVDEVEAELVELVDYLKNPQKYAAIGAKIPKGVLLVGPPGTGKTLLARAVAGEAGVPFFYISASEFIELFVGLGAARVRDLFRQARERAPAIVFIDEIDSIGQSRAGATGPQVGSHQEQEQTLQQLLTEMDGFEPNSGVIIMAASNRPEVLDQALLRPGRFDRQIQVNLPDIRGRREILEIHARSVALDPDVDLEVLARRTPGFSGAQLANVINEGALLAARKGLKKVTMVELEEAIDRVVAGLERRSQVLSEDERRLVAYHEMGHALVAHFVEHSDPVHRISIIPRGIGALGYTQQLPDEERYLMSEPELRDRVAVLMGGRSAEEIVFGYATTGAGDDLKRATEIARRMVTEFGMSERVGPVNVVEHGARFLSPALQRAEALSEKTEEAIDREVRAILIESKGKAVEILKDHRGDLDALAELLLKKETLSRRDLEDYFGSPYEAAPEIPQVGLVGAAEDGGSRAAPEHRASESSTDVGQPAVPVPGAERRDPPADSSSTLEMRRDERDEGSRGGSRGRPS